MEKFSIRHTYSGKTILVSGVSGFLGKVYLCMLLHACPDVRRIYVMIRRKGEQSGCERFLEMLRTSHAFLPLYEKYGAALSTLLREKVCVLEGDASHPRFGFEDHAYEKLLRETDLFVNFAGLVEFFPEVSEALRANVESALHAGDFIRVSENAKLLQVSTCYVSGKRHGRIEEDVEIGRAPSGADFNAEQEYQSISNRISEVESQVDSVEFEASLLSRIQDRNESKGKPPSTRIDTMVRMLKRRALREALIAEGKSRAEQWGWTNTYTYSKALGERLLFLRAKDPSRISIFRPAIVESAVSFPFPGWNEGFNTSGPLAYLLATWFRFLPSKRGNPFDVVPVDYVCRGLLLSGAEIIMGEGKRVYQCGTSSSNCFTINRACELTSLAHRAHFRKHGRNFVERFILSRWDAVSVAENYPFSVTRLKGVVGWIGELLKEFSHEGPTLLHRKAARASEALVRLEKKMRQADDLLKLFKPFIHDYDQVFLTKNLESIDPLESELRFQPQKIDWRKYWLDIHMPGLRKWCFPLISNLAIPEFKPPFQVEYEESEREAEKNRLENVRAALS